MIPIQVPSVPPALPDSVPTVHQELSMLSALPFDELISRLVNVAVSFAINVGLAIVVFYAGRFIIRKIYSLVGNIFARRHVESSLRTFILSLLRIVLYFILVVTIIGILGIETSSFIALFASAGVAIGMALSGTLQNFAGGVLILLLKPYRIGDYIEVMDYAGTVTEIQIFNTIISTPDNKNIIIPNGPLSTSSINNYNRMDYRRVDWTIGISYGDDVDAARAKILSLLAADPDVVEKYIEDDRLRRGITAPPSPEGLPVSTEKADRAPSVVLKELAASSVNLRVTAWTHSSAYWNLYFRINEKIYKELGTVGVSFPFPQLDVHVKQNPNH